jgi:hypothetical protein
MPAGRSCSPPNDEGPLRWVFVYDGAPASRWAVPCYADARMVALIVLVMAALLLR